MKKDLFERWNNKKIEVDTKTHSCEGEVYIKERDVWDCFVGKNIGFEQDGGGEEFLRPVLIIKKFNRNMCWIVPLSTKQKDLDFYYNFIDHNSKKVSIILAQLRLISSNRLKRKMYKIEKNHFNNIKKELRSLL